MNAGIDDVGFAPPLQGYLAHGKLLPLLGSLQGPRHRPTVGS